MWLSFMFQIQLTVIYGKIDGHWKNNSGNKCEYKMIDNSDTRLSYN